MPGQFTHDVFLSHSAKDKAVVHPLVERLRADRLKVWFHEWELGVAASRQSAANSPAGKTLEGTEDGGALPRRRYMEFIVAEAGQIYRGYTNSDHGIDGEIEFKSTWPRSSRREEAQAPLRHRGFCCKK